MLQTSSVFSVFVFFVSTVGGICLILFLAVSLITQALDVAKPPVVPTFAEPIGIGDAGGASSTGDLAGVAAAPRQARQIEWCGFQLAPLKNGGWGATCRLHVNEWDGPKAVCKKSIAISGMPDSEARVRMKLWLLEGCSGIDVQRIDARDAHKAISAPSLKLMREELVDRQCELHTGKAAGDGAAENFAA